MREREQGFSLIEVMLSIAIVAMIATLVWGSFSITSRSKRKAEEMSDRYHQVRLAMNRMSREISMAYLSKNQQPGLIAHRTFFTGQRERSVDDLAFSSLAHVQLEANAKECDQSVIHYYGKHSRRRLRVLNFMRRETRRLGGEKPTEQGAAYVALENIKEVHFDYYDAQKEAWVDEWNTQTTSGQPDRLPAKVRILITFEDERGEEVTFRTTTQIQLLDPLWFTSSSA